MKKILINTNLAYNKKLEEKYIDKIKNVTKGFETIFTSDKNEIEKFLKQVEIFVTFPYKITEISKNLKWIHSFSAGVDKILNPSIIDSDIIVTNSSGVHPIPITEHVFGMILHFERNFHNFIKNQKIRKWEKTHGLSELHGKTILILGLGNIGSRIAKISKAFDMNVLATKKEITQTKNVDELHYPDNIDNLLQRADYVVCCLPSTKETFHLFDKKRFSKMKTNSILINIGRGDIIDENALIKALVDKKISGAGLDVFEKEPLLKKSKLWDMDNVIISPHVSGWSVKYMDRAIEIFCKNMLAYKKSEPMLTLINKKYGY